MVQVSELSEPLIFTKKTEKKLMEGKRYFSDQTPTSQSSTAISASISTLIHTSLKTFQSRVIKLYILISC